MRRINHLDGLRAVAALAILCHHSITSFFTQHLDNYGLQFISHTLSSFTQSGVELFFVLSGLVLSITTVNSKKKFNTGVYLKKRFRRIYPPYFFSVVFASFVIAINTFFPTWYSAILIKFTPGGFTKQFFVFNQNWDYYNLAWWSLQLEILFYLLLPLIIKKIDVIRKQPIYLLISITFIATLILQQAFIRFLPTHYSAIHIQSNLYRFIDYTICFLLGIWLSDKMNTIKFDRAIFVVAVTLILASYYYDPISYFGWGLFYFSVIAFAQNNVRLRNTLNSYTFQFLGERSYSIFLTHFSVFYLVNYLVSYFVPERNFLYGASTRLIGIPLSLIIAFLLFHFVERKFARGLETADTFFPVYRKKNVQEPVPDEDRYEKGEQAALAAATSQVKQP